MNRNGERLGKACEVQDASFKVDAPFQPDYWLPLNTVSTADGERISLTFPKERLDSYKSNEPLVA